ncbi:SusC/RagA family TonB-linked outer membrane protein [Pedobacter sp. KR3-3]|uniref:SusC/RagA family TonB-linked outer membrane protein n=1 Tax=Pedobacter albus TaxID=3113905 RepID=A0ABU7I424_9SPHI|nr:SusC/RagA family TonB-linked outer membrane protein [Pedobacter sp. KR3-3]MEE1944223.1 SusC/RagA family TonB-linked outer membrane protein [Pedobacter sp. KR3-3]
MRNIYLFYAILLLLFNLPATSYGQSVQFEGIVLDQNGQALEGVTITVDGNDLTTDRLGHFQLSTTLGAAVRFSLDGYQPKTVSASKENLKEIRLEQASGKTVNLLYQKVPKSRLLQSVSEVGTEDLVKAPVNNVRNAIAGRLAGLKVNNGSGNPIFDGASLTLRGQSPGIMVDGVFRDYLSMAPEEIESITVLKDGLSTALLGQRGSNGVLSIKTRSGQPGKLQISLKAQTGVQKPLQLQRPLGAAQWATLFNEAMVNDGGSRVYSDADIQAYQNGTDPLGHPNVDWFNTILEPKSWYSRYNLYASGASKTAKYFTSVDLLSNDGLFKTDDKNPYNTNTNFNRVSIRSNIEASLTKSLSLNVGVYGRIQGGNEPGTSSDNIFDALYNTPNNAYPVFARGDSLGTSSDYQSNIWGLSTRSGYTQRYNRDLSFDVALKKTLDAVLPGLWVRVAGTYNTSLSEVTNRNKTYASFQRLVNSSTNAVTYQQYSTNGQLGNPSGISQSISRNVYFDVRAGYSKDWANDHSLNVLLIGNTQNVVNAYANLPAIYNVVGAQASYAYKNRYLAEVALSYSGFNGYAPGQRWGVFPAIGLGWIISDEPFMAATKNWLSNLKLRTTYGRNGNINVGYFAYGQYYGGGNSYIIGSGATSVSGVTMSALANPNITWEKSDKINVGMDLGLFQNKFTLSVDYYNNRFFDLAQVRGKNTGLLGTAFPNENIGRERYTGTEFELTYNGKSGDFNYFVSGNFTARRSKSLYFDEVNQPYSYMNRTGQQVGQAFGYIAQGLFSSDAEAAASPSTEGYVAKAGDIKYADLNGDGVINYLDVAPITPNKPILIYGVSLGFSWKGLDLSVLVEGNGNRYVNIAGNRTFAFTNNGKGQAWPIDLDRWTPQTAATATFPRLSIANSAHNQATSSFWYRSASYVRLKNAEIGYTLPLKWSTKLKLSNVRFFVNGQNLLTATPLDYLDPEGLTNQYPLQRVMNMGVNVKF